MILLLDKNDIEKRSLDCGVSVSEILRSFPFSFQSVDYAKGYFAGLTQGSIRYVIYEDSCLLLNKYNDAMMNRKDWNWYMVEINIVSDEY